MANLSINTVELVSTIRKAPKNGAPSSQDYNDSMREVLADLSTFASFVNESLLPVINALPEGAAQGLEGRTMFAGIDQTNPLFYSSAADRYLTVAEVLTNVSSMTNAALIKITDLGARVTQLQTKLATTNQNDILASIQGFSDQLRQVAANVMTVTQAATTQGQIISGFKGARASTGDVPASGALDVTINWPTPFLDNSYTVSVSVDELSKNLSVVGWGKLPNGAGLTVRIANRDSSGARTGEINAIAKAD